MQTRPCKVDLASQCGVCRASGRGEARRVQVGERPILKCRGRWYRVSGSRPPPTCRGKAENFRSGSKGILQGAWCVPSVCFTEINAPSSDNELDAEKNAEDAVSQSSARTRVDTMHSDCTEQPSPEFYER